MDIKEMSDDRAELIAYTLYGMSFYDLDEDRRENIYELAEKDALDKVHELEDEMIDFIKYEG